MHDFHCLREDYPGNRQHGDSDDSERVRRGGQYHPGPDYDFRPAGLPEARRCGCGNRDGDRADCQHAARPVLPLPAQARGRRWLPRLPAGFIGDWANLPGRPAGYHHAVRHVGHDRRTQRHPCGILGDSGRCAGRLLQAAKLCLYAGVRPEPGRAAGHGL